MVPFITQFPIAKRLEGAHVRFMMHCFSGYELQGDIANLMYDNNKS